MCVFKIYRELKWIFTERKCKKEKKRKERKKQEKRIRVEGARGLIVFSRYY